MSIGLALAGVATTPKIDDILETISKTKQEDVRRTTDLLSEYWQAYGRFSAESRERWATGTWLRGMAIPHAPGLAAHSFFWVVEREFRTAIVDRFGKTVSPAILNIHEEKAKFLAGYLRGHGGLTLRQIIKSVEDSGQSSTPLLAAFGQWLQRELPWLKSGLRRIDTDKISEIRKNEVHAAIQTNANDATTMARICREMLDLVYAKPR